MRINAFIPTLKHGSSSLVKGGQHDRLRSYWLVANAVAPVVMSLAAGNTW